MPERRFRDMRLTEGDVLQTVHFHWWTVVYQKQKGAAWRGSYNKFLDRSKRLLPLWRDIGLRELGTRVSPWRSLKDDPPPLGAVVIIRAPLDPSTRIQCVNREGWEYEAYKVRSQKLVGFTEYMEVPE